MQHIVKQLKLSDIELNSYNPNKMQDNYYNALKNNIKQDGYLQPLLVNHIDDKYVIIDGEHRYKALKELGFDKVDCWIISIPEAEAKKLTLKMGLSGEYDSIHLSGLLDSMITDIDIDIPTIELDMPHINLSLLDMKFNSQDDKSDIEDDIPEVETKNIITKTGDIWLLGKHRLICGDSTEESDIRLLMDGQEYKILLTDPPFDMDIKWLNVFKNKFIMGADKQLINLIQIDNTFKHFLCHYYEFGFALSSTMPQMAHHLIGIFGDNKYKKIEGDILKTVIKAEQIIKGKEKYQKPITVFEKIINHYSNENDLILDLFLYSGSTLIACEKTNRICYGIEIDTYYCDVIVKRFLDYVGSNENVYLIRDGKKIKYTDIVINNKKE